MSDAAVPPKPAHVSANHAPPSDAKNSSELTSAATTGDHNNGALIHRDEAAAAAAGERRQQRRVRLVDPSDKRPQSSQQANHRGSTSSLPPAGVRTRPPSARRANPASVSASLDYGDEDDGDEAEERTPLTKAEDPPAGPVLQTSDVEVINTLIADLSKLDDPLATDMTAAPNKRRKSSSSGGVPPKLRSSSSLRETEFGGGGGSATQQQRFYGREDSSNGLDKSGCSSSEGKRSPSTPAGVVHGMAGGGGPAAASSVASAGAASMPGAAASAVGSGGGDGRDSSMASTAVATVADVPKISEQVEKDRENR